ncbi:MAG: hypothetical protein FD131_4583 [Rhodocyclaceae bacterium]|nr:MAG: hypothetical protein FD131_4583 [Rhodocyclaceae bacterium]
MNTTTYIHTELRNLECAANVALDQIRRSTNLRDVVLGMNVQVPPLLRSLRHLTPSLSRIEREAFRRAESIARGQIAALGEELDEAAFLRQRGLLMNEWRHLRGRFPKLATYVQVESDRLLAKLRPHHNFPHRCAASATR